MDLEVLKDALRLGRVILADQDQFQAIGLF